LLLAETNQENFDLSLVVPAYNEEERLPTMLEEHLKFIEQEMQKSNS
jgi:hypothetical protein